jgi:hypothetical protein
MPGITRYEKTPQPVREITAEGGLRSDYRCLELETDYRTNTIAACLGIYRPVERQLKIRGHFIFSNRVFRFINLAIVALRIFSTVAGEPLPACPPFLPIFDKKWRAAFGALILLSFVILT